MRKQGSTTKYPGVKAVGPGRFRVRFKITDPRTGRPKEVDKLIDVANAKEAAAKRSVLMQGEKASTQQRTTVGDYARLWIASKTPTLDEATADRYTEALEQHVLPTLGKIYFDALRPADVQAWVNDSARKLRGKVKRKRYSIVSVRGWYRVLRTMTRDAVAQLDLPRDPTARITFPERIEHTSEGEDAETNALTPEQLGTFLEAMATKHPQHHALAATLAFTGLRFCHASALRWEDIDETAGVLRVRRKNIRGRIGVVSRVKRAPRELPLVPELASILKAHHDTMLADEAPGFDSGWCFPSRAGGLRAPSTMQKAWKECTAAAGVGKRFTPHGLRRTFNDLTRRAGVDAIVTRSMTGHVTERMQEHYSSVGIDEKRSAVARVLRLVKGPEDVEMGTPAVDVGIEVGTVEEMKKAG